MNDIARQDEQAGMPVAAGGDSTAALINMVERASTNPDVDVEKLERLWSMYDAERNRQAEQAFNSALAKIQSDLPTIPARGQIKHNNKLISTYGRWDEDILPIIRPVLKAHGFGLSFRTETRGEVTVEAVLSHEAGHSERTSITLAPDNSGSKSGPQAVASSVSYGKRYTAASLLNLEIHGQDDDAQAASAPERISAQKADEIEKRIEKLVESGKMPESKPFFDWMRAQVGASRVADLNEQGYETVCKALKKKEDQ